ncbi:MAG: hypothetical protein V4569_07815 [Pseudomonadota bacterium]
MSLFIGSSARQHNAAMPIACAGRRRCALRCRSSLGHANAAGAGYLFGRIRGAGPCLGAAVRHQAASGFRPLAAGHSLRLFAQLAGDDQVAVNAALSAARTSASLSEASTSSTSAVVAGNFYGIR